MATQSTNDFDQPELTLLDIYRVSRKLVLTGIHCIQ